MSISITRITGMFARGLTQLFFPNSCWACAKVIDENQSGFCAACRSLMTHDTHPVCPKCAATVGPHSNTNEGCPSCRKQLFAFQRAFRLGIHDGVLREVILRMKHWSGEGLAEMVGRIWAAHLVAVWGDDRPDFIIPVPLHWKRRFARGYNQSQVLAEEVARQARIPCRPSWIRRVRNTPRQAGQDVAARRKNVAGAFRAGSQLPIRGKSVLLIDDVMTTGATLHEASRTLRPFRPACISVAVLSRP